MKKLYSAVTTMALMLAIFAAGDAFAVRNFGDKKYSIKVHDQRSMNPGEGGIIEDATVYVMVFDAGTKTLSTIYSDTARTSKTNPITRSQFGTDDGISFYGPNSSYDLFIAHSDGSVAKYAGVSPRVHRLDLDRTGSDKVLVFPMVFNAGGTETDTGVDLPLGSFVVDAIVEVLTVDATETVDLGLLSSETNGDADGFLNDVSVATAGVPARLTYTTGANETYLSAVSYGALLAAVSLGNDVATDVGSFGRLTHYVTGSNATSITYTPSTSDTFVGTGYVFFKLLR